MESQQLGSAEPRHAQPPWPNTVMATTGRGVSFSNNCFAVTSGNQDAGAATVVRSNRSVQDMRLQSLAITVRFHTAVLLHRKSSAKNFQNMQGRVSTFEYDASDSLNELPMAIGPINEAGNVGRKIFQ
ncbi:hypothetical protein EDD17DRAFT_1506904 [Pisolithus thermaeus]|nr:hypothetical protein EDD17DRAFT_1506904 [Pisolithus thermaeus]